MSLMQLPGLDQSIAEGAQISVAANEFELE